MKNPLFTGRGDEQVISKYAYYKVSMFQQRKKCKTKIYRGLISIFMKSFQGSKNGLLDFLYNNLMRFV